MEQNKLNQKEVINELLKLLVDGYLKRKDLMDSEANLKKQGITNEKGKIYNNQVLILQQIIQDELNIFGLNLVDLVKQKGYVFKVGELSPLEQEYINNKVNNMLGFIDKFEERKNNKST